MTMTTIPIIAQAQAPTLFPRLVFGDTPGLAVQLLYSFLLVATVFLGGVSLIAMFSIWWER